MAEEFPPPPDGELEEGEFPEGEFPEGEEGAPDDAAAYEEEELLMAFTPNDKLQRVSEIDVMEQPESYRNNTKKEELMLEYVSNFRRQFEDIYPGRKPLLLCPLNECGMRKFVCTTLRPTQLPYQELYDYDKCAKFVADFLRYEPLELSGQIPRHLPSPAATLGWQAGDCFDCAQALCSLLLGVGYDAYVVAGYAPRAITQCDQSAQALAAKKAEAAAAAEEEEPKYVIPPRKPLESEFLKAKEAKRLADEAAAARPPVLDVEDGAAAETEAEALDEQRGRRVHAWVMVLAGKRMLDESLFLEPSTGAAYPLGASPYYAVEALWNSANYWVNMQGAKPPSALSFELSNVTKWEYVLLDKDSAVGEYANDEEDGEDGAALASARQAAAEAAEAAVEPAEGDDEKLELDMPPSWVAKLNIPRARYEGRTPAGMKATLYRKARLEKFAAYSLDSGMVERLTVFADALCLQPVEVRATPPRAVPSALLPPPSPPPLTRLPLTPPSPRQIRHTYAFRKDKLAERIVKPEEATTIERFDPGRPKGLREHVLVEGVRRELFFYASSRLDGLLSRTENFGAKTVQLYDGSKDALVYRSVAYKEGRSAGDGIGGDADGGIRKLAEKFRRTPEADAEVDVAKRTFDLGAGTITVLYHYGADRVTRSSRTFSKDGREQRDHQVVQVDPFSREPDAQTLHEEFQKLLSLERDAINEARESERQARDLLKRRAEEEGAIVDGEAERARAAADGAKGNKLVPSQLHVSVYDTARSKLATDADDDGKDAGPAVAHDYLTPFLPTPIPVDGPPCSKDEAFTARDSCLKALKERLVERANIVQSRLDEENAALSKRQAAFQRNRDHMEPADEAEYERYCQEAMFRIQILEQRLDRHTDLSLQKYAEMDARLRNDPRLRMLSTG